MSASAEAPFPGLRPFGREDAPWYFGRSKQVDDLHMLINACKFVTVTGGSGVGKSSLFYAGLMPRLETENAWHLVEMKPRGRPRHALGEAFIRMLARSALISPSQVNSLPLADHIQTTISRSALGLFDLVQEWLPPKDGKRTLVLVDQFEEIFRFPNRPGQGAGTDAIEDEAAAFVALLLRGSEAEIIPIHVMLTMRADYIGDCIQFEGLPEAISHGQYLVPRLNREQLESVVCEPVRRTTGAIDHDLVEQLLNDSAKEPDMLPILQHALMRLWDMAGVIETKDGDSKRLPPSERHLTLDLYRRLGGMRDGLSHHADSVLQELVHGESDINADRITQQVMRALTQVDHHGRAIRRPISFEQLVEETGHSAPDVMTVIDAMRSEERSFIRPGPESSVQSETVIDIGHEALIRRWKKIENPDMPDKDGRPTGWLRDEERDSRLFHSLIEEAHDFEQTGTLLPPNYARQRLTWWKERPRSLAWARRYGGGRDAVERLLNESVLDARYGVKLRVTERASTDPLEDISSTTIEFFRFGDEPGVLRKDNKYIRTCGDQQPADEVSVRIDPKELRRSLNRLRYRPDGSLQSEKAALELLGAEADWFLPESKISLQRTKGLHQVEMVTHASELREYPFEAIYASSFSDCLESPDKGVILTRRIRSEFSHTVPPWPEVPSVLFVHAQVDDDLSRELIDKHRESLCKALEPWGKPGDIERRKLLVVREIDSVEGLLQARALGNFSYIHILAAGERVAEADMEEHETEWGLRLASAGSDVASPKAVAEALLPDKDHLVVVTLAACDSDSPGPELGSSNLVETLHRNGISVVISSRFPLTKPGSVTLTSEFYSRLLSGKDVRFALHAARVALRAEARTVQERRHDWLSLVAYVRLPAEGYSQHLRAFGLRMQLHVLEAARQEAEPLFQQSQPPRATFDTVERRLRESIVQLRYRKEALDVDSALQAECAGLLASASKHLAELYFVQARNFPEDQARLEDDSKAALAESLKWYSEIYRRNLTRHWHGIQKLALEAALTGHIDDPTELMLVRRLAQNECDENLWEYWAYGAVAETILLGTLTPEGFDLTSARGALNLLQEHSARDSKDNGFAVKTMRRQLERYVTWWIKANGYFPGRESDISAQAQQLVACLPT